MQYQKAVEAIVLQTLDDHRGEEKRYPALCQKGNALQKESWRKQSGRECHSKNLSRQLHCRPQDRKMRRDS